MHDDQTGALEGRVVAVTGAGRGIGRAIALHAAAAGASVVAGSRTTSELDQLRSEIAEASGECTPVRLDVTDLTSITAFFDAAREAYGRLDGLVNNAGGGSTYATLDFSEEDFDWSVDLNFKSVFFCSQLGIRLMLDGGGGSIVNITSMGGLLGLPGRAAYCAVKAGVNNMTRSMAAEFASAGIRVNAVAPGMVNTPIFQRSMQGDRPDLRSMIDAIPLGRILEGADVTPMVVLLLSDASAMVTGQVIPVDGGQSAVLAGQRKPPASAREQTTRGSGNAE